MTNQGIDIQHPKLRGEWAELRFMARAAEHGLCIAKPWGDMARYDFAVEHNGRFLRVQVKCPKYEATLLPMPRSPTNKLPYAPSPSNFVSCRYVLIETVPEPSIPNVRLNDQIHITLYPPPEETSKYGQYKEAWHQLSGNQ